ncbi:MAG: NAD(+)/NADH kinase [Mycoplasma sp.]
MKYYIQTDLNLDKNKEIYNDLKDVLKGYEWDENDFEYLFIIGGDGSFLRYVNKYLVNNEIKVILINSGNLGFYSYISKLEDFKIEDITDESNYVNLDVLEISYRDQIYHAVNDFSFYSNFTSVIDTYINDTLLQTIHGNGMLVATPFGSTARNKSLGGAIIMPNSNALTIIEIEAINNRTYKSLNSPIVISNKSKIQMNTKNYHGAFLLIDGNEIQVSEDTSSITINNITSKVKVLIKTDDCNWIKKLNYSFK